mmetsp:Transcript_49321/g.141111  ORF Transcript_49321/g.141111 Transcript_49321/m.141111 type:complete len:301 (-) Transcript_49321:76-978(-)
MGVSAARPTRRCPRSTAGPLRESSRHRPERSTLAPRSTARRSRGRPRSGRGCSARPGRRTARAGRPASSRSSAAGPHRAAALRPPPAAPRARGCRSLASPSGRQHQARCCLSHARVMSAQLCPARRGAPPAQRPLRRCRSASLTSGERRHILPHCTKNPTCPGAEGAAARSPLPRERRCRGPSAQQLRISQRRRWGGRGAMTTAGGRQRPAPPANASQRGPQRPCARTGRCPARCSARAARAPLAGHRTPLSGLWGCGPTGHHKIGESPSSVRSRRCWRATAPARTSTCHLPPESSQSAS